VSAVAHCFSRPAGLPVLETALQPIVALRDEQVFAFEALARVRGIDTANLFERAAERRRAAELNLVAVRGALDVVPLLPSHALLFVNVDPIAMESPELPRIVRTGASRAGFPLSRLVVEITERSGFLDLSSMKRVIDDLRASQVRFALDDFGSASSHLALIDVIRPSFLKIGHGFGTAFEKSATLTHIVRHIAGLARDLTCSTILEGVESPATARAGLELGIEYAQGYHFGRPVVPSASPQSQHSVIRRVPPGIL